MSGPINIVLDRHPQMSVSQHTAAIDLRAFGDNGVVTDKEYARINEHLLEKLSGLRVPVIRKGFELEPYTYDEYVATANQNYDRAHAPMGDPEMGIEINTVSVIYRAKVPMYMFPQFTREYFDTVSLQRISFADVAIDVNSAGYAALPMTQYRSLLLAALQIEQEIKERYKKSSLSREVGPDITVETRFMLPLTGEMADTEAMMIEIQIDLYPED